MSTGDRHPRSSTPTARLTAPRRSAPVQPRRAGRVGHRAAARLPPGHLPPRRRYRAPRPACVQMVDRHLCATAMPSKPCAADQRRPRLPAVSGITDPSRDAAVGQVIHAVRSSRRRTAMPHEPRSPCARRRRDPTDRQRLLHQQLRSRHSAGGARRRIHGHRVEQQRRGSSAAGTSSQMNVRFANFFTTNGGPGPAVDIYDTPRAEPRRLC